MGDEFDDGLDGCLDTPEPVESDPCEPSMDVDSFMDDVLDAPEDDFGEMEDSFDGGMDIDGIMDEAAMDAEPAPEVLEDIPDLPDEPVSEELPEEPEIPEEVGEEIPEEPEIPEEVAEDIPEEPEIPEEVGEDIPEEPEIPEEVGEDIPEEPEIPEEVAEDIPEEPETPEEVGEEIPEEPEIPEEVGEDIPEEPEIPEEVVEDIPEEPEIPEEVGEDIPEEPEIPEEVAEDIPEEPEIPEEVGEDIPEEPEIPEEIAEDIPEKPEIPEEVGEEIPEEPEIPEEVAEDIPEEPEIPEEVVEDLPDGPALEDIPEEREIPYEAEGDLPDGPASEEFPEDPEISGEAAENIPEVPEETADFGPKPAQNAMAEYLSEHNYGREDYEIYSKDPQWQQLNNDLLVELGEEPIDYGDMKPNGERVYDDFEQTVLENNKDFYESGEFYEQGVNELGYTGTCGETSMANTINRVLGTNEFTENKVLNVAVEEGLCDTDSLQDSGGTTTKQFLDLYEKMNEQCGGQLDVQCYDYENVLPMEDVAQKLEEGCTINVAVDANTLWDISDPMGGPFPESRATDHWITVTGVHRGDDGIVQGFDIVDSGGGVNYVDADKYQAMCYGTEDLNLTDPTCIVVQKSGESLSDVPQTESVQDIPQVEPVQDVPQVEPVQDVPQVEPVQDVPQIGPMKPNDTYESNGYTYRTDAAGRIISASGELHLSETMDRDPAAQLQAGGDSREGTDDGGHLIATRFGGSPGLDNLVAENSFINRSQYKQLENAWARDLAAGNRVIVNIEPYYGGDTERPTHITGSYTVIRPDGKSFSDSFSLTNDDLRAEEYQMDFDDGDGDFYNSLSPEEREAYEEAMAAKPLKIDEGRVFR